MDFVVRVLSIHHDGGTACLLLHTAVVDIIKGYIQRHTDHSLH